MNEVDVLESMEAASKRLRLGVHGPITADSLDKARAAVAELIEAANAVSESCTKHYGHSMLLHLDVAATGGKNERLKAALSRVLGSA